MFFFSSDYDSKFSVSSAEWYVSAYHNALRALHHHKLTSNIEEIQTIISIIKIMKVDIFLEHFCHVLAAFQMLFEHYMNECHTHWQIYQHQQWVIHKFCMQVKKNQQLKKKQMIVIFNDRRFTSFMKRKRETSVKKLTKKLHKYVTVMHVNEFWISRMCSNQCLYEDLNLRFESERDRERKRKQLEKDEQVFFRQDFLTAYWSFQVIS